MFLERDYLFAWDMEDAIREGDGEQVSSTAFQASREDKVFLGGHSPRF